MRGPKRAAFVNLLPFVAEGLVRDPACAEDNSSEILREATMNSFSRRDLLLSGLALSASTLVPGSLQRAHALLDAYPAPEPAGAVAPRERLLFDFGWKFFRATAPIPHETWDSAQARAISPRAGNSGFPRRSSTTRNGATQSAA